MVKSCEICKERRTVIICILVLVLVAAAAAAAKSSRRSTNSTAKVETKVVNVVDVRPKSVTAAILMYPALPLPHRALFSLTHRRLPDSAMTIADAPIAAAAANAYYSFSSSQSFDPRASEPEPVVIAPSRHRRQSTGSSPSYPGYPGYSGYSGYSGYVLVAISYSRTFSS